MGDFLEEVTVSQNLRSQQAHKGKEQPEQEVAAGGWKVGPPGVSRGRGVGEGGGRGWQPALAGMEGLWLTRVKGLGAGGMSVGLVLLWVQLPGHGPGWRVVEWCRPEPGERGEANKQRAGRKGQAVTEQRGNQAH